MSNKINPTALFNIGYGLYVVTAKENNKDNGCIVNAVTQLTDKKLRVAVTINKQNLTHDMIKNTGILNVNCLSEETPFEIFEYFGFQSGRDVEKFVSPNLNRSENELVVLPYTNCFFSLKVEQQIDLDTHTMFICEVTEAKALSDEPTMTYAYYHKNVKPKPKKSSSKGWVCTICGYVHEDEQLPDDFICPLCKHGVDAFERIK